jgi:hypothetical protein
MEAKTELVLPVIDASQEDWEEKSNWEEEVRAALASRTNFVVVFNPNSCGPQKLTNLLDCAPNALARLSRWGLHGLMDALSEEHYRWLNSICGACDVRIVEQLNLISNHPPQTKPYIVYCEIHGVVSDHDDLESARAAYSAYLAQNHPRAQRFPRSGVYHWEDQAWQPVAEETRG